MTNEDITAVFARLQDGYARLDPVALANHYSEDCVVESPVAGVHVGRLAIEQAFRMIFSAFPNMSMHTEEFLIFGNRALWTFRVNATDYGGLMGLPPTGKPFSTSVIFLYTFGNDHKIVHERRTYDFSRMLLQLAGEAEPATQGPRLYREMLDRVRHEHELHVASEIQRQLLPGSRYTGAGFELAAASVPCRAIGGDFFDYFNLSDHAFAFLLGDVAGKGPPAALLAALLQGVFAANAHRGGTPADMLGHANAALFRRAIEARFATVVYAVLSGDGRLTYSNGGHNPPFLIRKRGIRRLDCGGLIVGAFEQATFHEEAIQLESGDLLVAFSDGVTEALNTGGQEFGEERLLSCVTANRGLAPTSLLDCLLDAVHEFSDAVAQTDDITMLVLRYSGDTLRSDTH